MKLHTNGIGDAYDSWLRNLRIELHANKLVATLLKKKYKLPNQSQLNLTSLHWNAKNVSLLQKVAWHECLFYVRPLSTVRTQLALTFLKLWWLSLKSVEAGALAMLKRKKNGTAKAIKSVLKRRRESEGERKEERKRELISDHFSDWIRETQHCLEKRREEDITFRLLFLCVVYLFTFLCARVCVCCVRQVKGSRRALRGKKRHPKIATTRATKRPDSPWGSTGQDCFILFFSMLFSIFPFHLFKKKKNLLTISYFSYSCAKLQCLFSWFSII